jgi:hypothetical protein
MPEGAYINVYLNSNEEDILLISNSGECIERLLNEARAWREVEQTEMDEAPMTDYIAPEDPAAPNEEPQNQIYKYRVITQNGVQARTFVTEFESRARQVLSQNGLTCEVRYLT